VSARDPRLDASVRRAAMASAGRGWYVFPTRPGGKEPRRGLSWPRAATADLAALERARWRPGENYGIAAKPSDLVVVDLDQPKPGCELAARWRGWADEPGIRDGRDVLAALAARAAQGWPHTFTVTTPSGGVHLYYLAPAGRPIGNKPLGPMIDIRGGGEGDGGYVLGPGSIMAGRAYEITDDRPAVRLPAWIADQLDPPRRPVMPGAPAGARPGDRVAARLDGLIAAVLDAVQGERNNVLHWAACRAAEMVAAGQITDGQVHDSLGRAAACAGLDDSEAERTIASAFRHALRSSA
jgi:Bifunctional DNA primase/polymerase, N-terminal